MPCPPWMNMAEDIEDDLKKNKNLLANMAIHGRMDELDTECKNAAMVSMILATWNLTKDVYTFDTSFFEELWLTDINKETRIPRDVIQTLPAWGACVLYPYPINVMIDTYEKLTRGIIVIPFYRISTSIMGAILGHIGDENIFIQVISFEGDTIWDCVEQDPYNIDNFKRMERSKEDLIGILNILLYVSNLCNDSSKADKYPRYYPKLRKKGKKQMEFIPEKEVTQWQVGFRIGEMLRRHVTNSRIGERGDGGGWHYKRRPTIRRAHWHLYWTGKGRLIPRLKWVHAHGVNCELGDDGLPIVQHDVEVIKGI